MNKVFFGTILSHAKREFQNVEPLLIRASGNFLTEKSIDNAIQHLEKTKQLLLDAKHAYIHNHHQSGPKVLK
jgi:hypothetical protein